MNVAFGKSSVGLERDQMIALRDAKGTHVRVLDGVLWITQEGTGTDVLLEAGQSLVIDTPGLTLLMAMRPSKLRLRERISRPSALWQALVSWARLRPLRAGGAY